MPGHPHLPRHAHSRGRWDTRSWKAPGFTRPNHQALCTKEELQSGVSPARPLFRLCNFHPGLQPPPSTSHLNRSCTPPPQNLQLSLYTCGSHRPHISRWRQNPRDRYYKYPRPAASRPSLQAAVPHPPAPEQGTSGHQSGRSRLHQYQRPGFPLSPKGLYGPSLSLSFLPWAHLPNSEVP